MLEPVAEHDAVHGALVHVERVHGRAVRMAVQQNVAAMGANHRLDGILVDVGDLLIE